MKSYPSRSWQIWFLFGSIVVASLLISLAPSAQAAGNWYVRPSGAGLHNGRSWESAFATIQQALDVAQPGDTIYLGPGDYYEDLVTKRHGTASAPITLLGPSDAVVHGSGAKDRIFQIYHDYYRLDGWTINGHDGQGNALENYRNKLLYVHGQAAAYAGAVQRGPQGLEVRNMHLLNAGGECIRLRYFVQYANIHHNLIRNCGIYAFVFKTGGKNGEGIYIGTSSTQWGDGKNPTNEPDQTSFNHIHHNQIDTQGNECIEIKEGSTDNLIEENECTGGQDPDAAGLVSRGDGNIFRYNKTYGHAGGGLRLGGHMIDGYQYGVGNVIYGNTIFGNALGGIKFENYPQALVCGNILARANGESQINAAFGSYGEIYRESISSDCTIPAIGGGFRQSATLYLPLIHR